MYLVTFFAGKNMKPNTLAITASFVVLMVFSSTLTAQTVSTFFSGAPLNRPDGFAFNAAQELFVANWGGGTGTTVIKISTDGVASVIDSTSDAPDGLAFDPEGNLYISNYNSGIITRTTPGGVKSNFASGLVNPSALAFDKNGYLYVSDFGSTTVSKISPTGVVSTFAGGFSGPLGLVFDQANNLYVSNYNTGVVNKVTPEGVVTEFAVVPDGGTSKIQYLAIGGSGNLYLPSYGHHKIYRISASGEVTDFAGTGVAGYLDGNVDSARFNGPNSIAINNMEEIYVSEYNGNRIRKISGEFPAGATEPALENIMCYPVPFSSHLYVRFFSERPDKYSIIITDLSGKTIASYSFQNSQVADIIFAENELMPGIYNCSILSNGRVIAGRRIVKM